MIAEWVNYADLLEWAKLKEVVFKTGEFKDTGSPSRPVTENEKKYFQGLIDDMVATRVIKSAGMPGGMYWVCPKDDYRMKT